MKSLSYRLTTAISTSEVVIRLILMIRVLLKDIRSDDVRKEKARVSKSLGEALKENGTSYLSTSKLLALSNLYGISAEELLREVQ